jgi:peptidoglycan biosynthesis protein MviN/MurJ (putative lipid II flippase)
MLILIPFGSLFHNGASHELAAHATAALFIPVLWYFIGRRLERRGGVLTRPTMIGKVLTISGLTATALVAILIAVSLAFRSDEMVAARLLILSWAIGGILISSKTILHWRIRAATS